MMAGTEGAMREKTDDERKTEGGKLGQSCVFGLFSCFKRGIRTMTSHLETSILSDVPLFLPPSLHTLLSLFSYFDQKVAQQRKRNVL